VKAAVVVFPGSNCDLDAAWAWRTATGGEAELVWHERADLGDAEAVILPGGFAHGDYLRPGALCRFSPVMGAVRRAAEAGMPILGICNGFQILCEAGLLPGALTRNRDLTFHCHDVWVRVERSDTAWTAACGAGRVLRLPIAHGEGRFWLPADELERLRAAGGVVFRYVARDGSRDPAANPNGSVDDIAGVANPAGNVVGLMPHPERAVEALLGSEDGLCILRSAAAWWAGRRAGAMARG
jgi:phosphoribosylformylglycinamidine synthase I